MKRFLLHPSKWFIERLGLAPILTFLREHKVPPGLGGKRGWMYVFGAATMVAFINQVLTGIGLTTAYIPSPDQAHASLEALNATRSGALVRAMHFYGASAMVVLILVHAARVFLTGSYKFPRQFNWITGVVLLILTFVMAVTGQLLRWDENGVWTVVVAAKFLERVPLMGAFLAEFALAGPTLSGETLTRFFSLHVIVVPLLIAAIIGAHLYLLAYQGISELPSQPAPLDLAEYKRWYRGHKESMGLRYWPDSAWREPVVGFVVIVLIAMLAMIFGPQGPGAAPDPTRLTADPRPDWFVRWYYALLYIKPGGLEREVMVYLPLLVIAVLIALPLVFGHGERSLKARPWAPAIVVMVALILASLTYLGARVPWSPAYETQPLTRTDLPDADAAMLEGASVFYDRGCQYCHVVYERGGQWGPELTRVRLRLSPEEITVRIVMGYGDMPAYRDVLAEEELRVLVHFLSTLPERQRAREQRE